ncbi:hypothetical protein OROGR_030018 [Orobanche gracilis]
MEVEIETVAEAETTETSLSSLPGDLIAALEQATLMAKQLPITTDPSHLLQIHAALHSASRHLSLFLHPPPPPRQSAALPIPQPENSVSSAVGGVGEEPMEMGDDEDEHNSRAVERVEGRLRECCLQNKRLKRQLSPSTADRRRSYENMAVLGVGDGALASEFDPVRTKLRSLDLVHQFHA